MSFRILWIPLAFTLVAGGVRNSESVQTGHANVELLSQSSAIAPGQTVWLGVHFVLEKGWHIYWKNPGDSGQPPVLRWELPPGFNTGGIRWPRPEKFTHSSIADYGYENDVTLLVPLRVPLHGPGGAKTGPPAEIALDANWLICREICIPEKAQIRLSLPIAASPEADKKYTKLFADTKRLLPKAWPAPWTVRAVSVKNTFVLSIQAGKTLPAGEFIPAEPSQIENAAPQTWEPTPQGAKIILKKSEQLLKTIASLKGLLVLRGGDSYEIRAPVTKR
jgi:DsbC/DsbD-like thiol-disulfide interchange protein